MGKYYIHDNGGRPFEVSIVDKKIIVKKVDEYKEYHKKILMIPKYSKVFIGKCKYAPECKKNPHLFDGSSILVNITGNKYVYVGSTIKSFTSLDTIKHFYSPVGRSDVPYPFAVGDTYTYLFIDNVYVPNKKIIMNPDDHFYPYTFYYHLESVLRDKVKLFGFKKLKTKKLA